MNQREHNNASSFANRGDTMDRLETFVAAAFAFAVTMLVISVDDVPTQFSEFVYATKLIPSFAASFAVVVWIWASHANWCRRYGLEDTPAIVLSAFLVFVVLIYIYPLRAMMQSLFSVLTNGYLPHEMKYTAGSEVRFTFLFYAIGFLLLALNFMALYFHAFRKRMDLRLSADEIFVTLSEIQVWAIVAFVSTSSIALAALVPINHIGLAGYVFFCIFPLSWLHQYIRAKQHQ